MIIDVILIVILGVCIVLAMKSIKKNKCHDCNRCDKKCGGKVYGKEFRTTNEDQRKSSH